MQKGKSEMQRVRGRSSSSVKIRISLEISKLHLIQHQYLCKQQNNNLEKHTVEIYQFAFNIDKFQLYFTIFYQSISVVSCKFWQETNDGEGKVQKRKKGWKKCENDLQAGFSNLDHLTVTSCNTWIALLPVVLPVQACREVPAITVVVLPEVRDLQ